MGGHGAIVLASLGAGAGARRWDCLCAAASWVHKEGYGGANAFASSFQVQSVAPRLVALFAAALAEYNPALLVRWAACRNFLFFITYDP